MGFFKRKAKSVALAPENDPQYAPPTQVEMIMHARIPVFLSKMHSEHPPRWVTVHGDRLESVVGLESEEYMNTSDNHEVWSVEHFINEFPFLKSFLNTARPGQSALFIDQSGSYVLDDD